MKIISKTTIYVISFLLLITSFSLSQTKGKYTIVIHGGAGYISPDIPVELKNAYISVMFNE